MSTPVNTPASHRARPFWRFPLRALGAVLVVSALAYVPVSAWTGLYAPRVLGLAAGVALLGAFAGHAAGALIPRRSPESPAQAAFVALGVRLMATTLLALGALQFLPGGGSAPAPAFALVLGSQYLALLVLEVGEALAEVRESGPGPRSDGGGTSA